MDKNICLMQIENACMHLTNMNEEVAFLAVNTVTKESSCIGSHVGIDFLNHNFKQESQDNNLVGLFNKFVSEHYNIGETTFSIEQKTITRSRSIEDEKTTDPPPVEMCIITTDQLDFSQSNLEDNFIQIQPLDNTKTDEIEPIEADKETSNGTNISNGKDTSNGTNISSGKNTSDGKKTFDDKETSDGKKTFDDKETSDGKKTFDDKDTSDGKKTFDDKETSGGSEAVKNNINEGNLKEAVCEEEANLSNLKNSTRRTSGRQKKELKSKLHDHDEIKTSKCGKTNVNVPTKNKKDANSNIKTPNSGNTSGVTVSRSGRKVMMPKWRLDDVWDVKEIKTEPDYDESYGGKNINEKDNFVTSANNNSSSRLKIKKKTEPGECSTRSEGKRKSSLKGPDQDKTGSNKNSVTAEPDEIVEKIKDKNGTKRKTNDSNATDAKRKREKEPQICKSTVIAKNQEVDQNEILGSKVRIVEELANGEPAFGKVDDGEETTDIRLIKEEKMADQDGEEDTGEELDKVMDSLFDAECETVSEDENEEIDLKEDFDAVMDDVEDNCSDKEKTQWGKWSCIVCNAKAKKCWLIRRHMRRMHDLNNKDLKPCRVCKKVMVYDECFHDKGENVKIFTCNICKKIFNTKFQLQVHEESHITEKEFPCNLCSKKFKSERYVKMHIYNTHNKRNGKALTSKVESGVCDICGKWFRFKCNAIRHREIHFEEKRFDCSICQMKFRHSSSLKRHMLSHQGKAEYVCEQCGRSFKMKQTLIQHHRIHVIQPFLKCEYCPREFRTYKGKKYHILKDHAEKAGDFSFKSFVCETCGKSSSSQSEYEEHKKNHDENRSHVCLICGCRWETAAQLKAHKKSHNVTPYRYRCKVCNIPFKEASKVRIHMTKESHIKTSIAMGLDPSKDNISEITNSDIVEIIEHEYEFPLQSEEELQQEIVLSTQEIEEIPEEIKVIHIDPQDYDGTGAHVQILNEEGVEIMYDRISLPQEEITVDGEQVIYQVEIDGQNAIICDTLTSQAVESILKLHSQT